MYDYYGISKEAIKSALSKFTGADRRFEYVGNYKNVKVYDDYAHHPTEIQSVVNSVKNKKYHENWIVFQSHTYSRTKLLLDDFAKVLSEFDYVIITDIYAAREINQFGISPEDLVNKINELKPNKAIYISNCRCWKYNKTRKNDSGMKFLISFHFFHLLYHCICKYPISHFRIAYKYVCDYTN